jgi:phosphoribosyl 1,2-cyclic phosphodiesterase
LRFAALGSGSRGNALLVEFKQTLVMVDCGLTLKAVEERIRTLGRDPRDITALLVTHEHSDHVRGVPALANRYRMPVWMTAGTASATASRGISSLKILNCHRRLSVGDLEIDPFPVPHDAREPCQFTFTGGARRLGTLSDTGHITPHIKERLENCDAMAIEFNHDTDALWGGDYPAHLKQRIASQLGHLSNTQAAELLSHLRHDALQWVMALHLSESNNTSARVQDLLASTLGDGHAARAHLAVQDLPSEWLEIA